MIAKPGDGHRDFLICVSGHSTLAQKMRQGKVAFHLVAVASAKL
jgi:hypothetical protein